MTSQTTTEAKAETWDVYAAWFPEQTGDIADPSPYWTENPNEIPDGYAPRPAPFRAARAALRQDAGSPPEADGRLGDHLRPAREVGREGSGGVPA
jgi:hypothetical protein